MSIKPVSMQKIIVVRRPALWGLSFLLVLCLIALLLWASYEYGRGVAGYDSGNERAYIDLLQAQLEESEAEILESNRQATMLERNSRIDDDASVQLKETLAQAQNEALELKKELSFYKSIVSPEQGGRSLAVQTIQLLKNAEGGYQYKITVSQRGRNDRFARGTIDISIKGISNGQPLTLALAKVANETKNPLKFSFKYFQKFEGVMNLPEAFQPDSIHIKVKPSTGKLKAVEEQFAWSDLTAGGA